MAQVCKLRHRKKEKMAAEESAVELCHVEAEVTAVVNESDTKNVTAPLATSDSISDLRIEGEVNENSSLLNADDRGEFLTSSETVPTLTFSVSSESSPDSSPGSSSRRKGRRRKYSSSDEDDGDSSTGCGEGIFGDLSAEFQSAKELIVRGEENLTVMFKNVKDGASERAEKVGRRTIELVEASSMFMRDGLHETAERIERASVRVKEGILELEDKAEKVSRKVLEAGREGWYRLSHVELPHWLRDNDFLSHGHRPPMPSFRSCFRSIFRIHTETGNIWTHLIGFIAFICVCLYMYLRPKTKSNPFPVGWEEKLVFGAFFAGAILCLGFSWLFHTVYCHSVRVSRIFSRLDYSGIALLIIGSFIPALYYGFYCSFVLKVVYMSSICFLGTCCIVVSLWSKFSTPKYRVLRAGLFLALGCSGIIPALHFMIAYGLVLAHRQASVGWMALMGLLYILGAITYATRIPERFFPGKFDLWFQSHQIFHVLVISAAFVHLHAISNMAYYRFTVGKSYCG